jgi:serine/threonine protein kinase
MQSLGCVLFALAYLRSPFENTQTTEQGGSIAMAVLNAQYKHPTSDYSQGLKTFIDSMLKINPQERPDIQQVTLLPYSNPHHCCSRHFQVLDATERLLQSA